MMIKYIYISEDLLEAVHVSITILVTFKDKLKDIYIKFKCQYVSKLQTIQHTEFDTIYYCIEVNIEKQRKTKFVRNVSSSTVSLVNIITVLVLHILFYKISFSFIPSDFTEKYYESRMWYSTNS